MDTIGILYSLRGGNPREEKKVTAQLHINYWKITNKERYIDFGLMLDGPYWSIKSIWFYFPFEVSKKDVDDLGNILNDTETICTLFDQNFTVGKDTQSSYSLVSANPNTSENPFFLYRLGEENFAFPEGFKKRVLEICFNSTPPSSPKIIKQKPDENSENIETAKSTLYLRIRVNVSDKHFLTTERIANDVFQSAFSKSELINIRINDRSELDYSVNEKLSKGNEWLTFSKIHFFYIGSSDEEQLTSSVPYKDCKLLNINKWASYLEVISSKKSHYLAYHWRVASESEMDKFGIFVRTIFKARDFLKILLYVIIVLLISALGSFLVTPIAHCVFNY